MWIAVQKYEKLPKHDLHLQRGSFLPSKIAILEWISPLKPYGISYQELILSVAHHVIYGNENNREIVIIARENKRMVLGFEN